MSQDLGGAGVAGEGMEKMQKKKKFTRDLEEQTNRDEQYTGRNWQQNNWGRRMEIGLEDRMVEITAIKQNIEKR